MATIDVSRDRLGKKIGLVVAVLSDVGALWLTFHLISQGRRHAAIGWGIISAFLLLTTIFSQIPARNTSRQSTPPASPHATRVSAPTDAFVQVFSSRDNVEVTMVRHALLDHGIEAILVDEHAGQLLQFLPGLEVKVKVPAESYAEAISVLQIIRHRQDTGRLG